MPPILQKIRLHLKVLEKPEIPIDHMLETMSHLFSSAGFQVETVSTEYLDIPHLLDIDVGVDFGYGGCTYGVVTKDQKELFKHRNNVGNNELTVYFVRTILPPHYGCAVHPYEQPGAVIARTADIWTLAHEIGHILGLRHVDNRDRLMHWNTSNITNLPPDLISTEIEKMRNSKYTIDN